MPYFPPVLLASGARAGAMERAQTFEDGIVSGSASSESAPVVISKIFTNTTNINAYGSYAQLIYHKWNPSAPASNSHQALFVNCETSGSTQKIGTLRAMQFYIEHVATQSADALEGAFGQINNSGNGTVSSASNFVALAQNTGSGTISTLIQFDAQITNFSVITARYGMRVRPAGGTITHEYGVYVDNMTGTSSRYAIYTNAGLVRFGDQVLLAAGTTAGAQMNFANGVAPTSANDGDVWREGTALKLVFGANQYTLNKQAAYTQTYSTADRTLNSYTSDPESSVYNSGVTAAVAGPNVIFSHPVATDANLNQLRVAYENLRTFTEDLAGVVNSLVDDLQAMGLAG